VQTIIGVLANSGAPDKALPIIDTLIVQNPGDPSMIRSKWALQLRAGRYKDALRTGDELLKADSAAGTVEFFQREIGAAQSDSNNTAVLQLAARAAQKFPKEVTFQLLMARGYIAAGQVQQGLVAAKRAIELDPKNVPAYLLALSAYNQLGQPDSAVAIAKAGIAAGASKDDIGAQLLATVGPALKKAQESKSRADWQEALKAAQTVDAVSSTPQSSFYVGVAAWQVASDILTTDTQPLVAKLQKKPNKAEQAQACEQAKQAEDLFATVSIALPKGGSVDKNTAGQILGAVGQYSEFINGIKKAYCK
jgi:predicted Zn-dependent protease